MNNKTLAMVFGGLLVIYFLTKLFSGSKERSFDPQIVAIDTSKVDMITVKPASEAAFTLKRAGSSWSVERDGMDYEATNTSVSSLLSNLVSINAERVVSKNPERLKDYAVDEETGTFIKVMSGGKLLSDLIVGRFNFNQATRSGTSYVKKADEPEVFAVEGFMSMSLSQGMDNYRNKEVARLNATDLTNLTMEENGQTISMMRPDSVWRYSDGMQVDSLAVSGYVTGLGSVNGAKFAQGKAAAGSRVSSLQISGNNMGAPVSIECYTSIDTSHHFVIHSSANQEGYFYSDSSGIYDRIFGKFPRIAN